MIDNGLLVQMMLGALQGNHMPPDFRQGCLAFENAVHGRNAGSAQACIEP